MGNVYSTSELTPPGQLGLHLGVHCWPHVKGALAALYPQPT